MDKRQIEKGYAGLHKNLNRLLRGIEMHPHALENGSVNEIEVPHIYYGKTQANEFAKGGR